MRQGAVLLVAAVFEAVLASLLGGWAGWLVGYVALVTGLVAVAHLGGWTWLLGKRPRDGRVPWWSLVVLWPWHLLTRGVFHLRRALSGETLTDRVGDRWLLGGWPHDPAARDPWPAVVDMTCELPRRAPTDAYLCLPTWDGTAPRPVDIERGAAFAVQHHREGHEVLVHCAAGHGRSTVVLAAALVRAGEHATWRDAVAALRKRRPGVRLVPEQEAALDAWVARFGP